MSHCAVRKMPTLTIFSIEMNSFYTLTTCFLEIYFNVFLPSTPRSPKWSFPFEFPDQNFIYTSHPSHLIRLGLPILLSYYQTMTLSDKCRPTIIIFLLRVRTQHSAREVQLRETVTGSQRRRLCYLLFCNMEGGVGVFPFLRGPRSY